MSEKKTVDWTKVKSMVATEEGLLVTERGEDGQVGLTPFLFQVQPRQTQVVVRGTYPLFFPQPAWRTPTWTGPTWVKLYIGDDYAGTVWLEAAKWLQNLEREHIAQHAPGTALQISWL